MRKHTTTVTLCALTLYVGTILGLSACSSPDTATPNHVTATDRIAPEVNITCAEFNKLSPQEQEAATDRLLRNYTQATKDSSEIANAREHAGRQQKLLSGDIHLGAPSLFTLAHSTCEIPTNQDVRLLTAMGFNK